MPEITIEPATAERFDDVEHALTGGGDGAGCQCQWWMLRNRDFDNTAREDRTELLRAETAQDCAPGLVAYVDAAAAAWVRVGPRTKQRRLAFTRAFATSSAEPWDDPHVWAVSCFVVRREHRGDGLMLRLLTAAVDYARDHGARTLEAYPIDTAVSHRSANDLYTGVLSVFQAVGFRIVARPKPDRVVVQLDL